jgi:hypothetical protein
LEFGISATSQRQKCENRDRETQSVLALDFTPNNNNNADGTRNIHHRKSSRQSFLIKHCFHDNGDLHCFFARHLTFHSSQSFAALRLNAVKKRPTNPTWHQPPHQSWIPALTTRLHLTWWSRQCNCQAHPAFKPLATATLNINGVKGKPVDLQCLLCSQKCDVIAPQETLLSSTDFGIHIPDCQ